MTYNSSRLAILVLSCLSWHLCLADVDPNSIAITFFELPYNALKDHLNRTRSVAAEFEREGCQPIQMNNGIHSLIPNRGMVCEIFS